MIVHAIVTSNGDRALQLIEEARRQPERAQILDDTIWHYIAWAHLLRGDIDASRAAAEEADRQLQGKAYAFFADWTMARAIGDPAAALARYQRADQRALGLGFKFVTLAVRREIKRHHYVNGEPLEALTVLSPVLEQFFAAGDLANWTGAASIAAVALSALGHNEVVAAILGAVEDRRAVASALSVLSPPERDAITERCRVLLGVQTFERLHAGGRGGGEKEVMDRVRGAVERVMATFEPGTRG